MIKKISKLTERINQVILIDENTTLAEKPLLKEEIRYIKEQHKENEKDFFLFNRLSHLILVQYIKDEENIYKRLENCRKAGFVISGVLNKHKQVKVIINDIEGKHEETLALAEGIALSNYQFREYKTVEKDKANTLKNISVFSKGIKSKDIERINIMVKATCWARDLVNEPVITLNAVKLAKEIEKMGKETGSKVEIMNKKKIESLKMGGLLAVNMGSKDPPTFSIFEWKPDKPINEKPYIFVGKGVVFDTGGLNLKPGAYMENMKSDMAGAAAVSSALYAIAMAKLPVHVIALIPATDNRPDGNAYVTGDVIRMYNGMTVEVLNTDAEGRMILADALSYAKKYDPELVIDVATLTGSAAVAIGKYGIVCMGTKSDDEIKALKQSGDQVYERLVEFPLWEEFGELIKSPIADIKNIGGRDAGAITAGKFLEHFTDYPYIHLDIAGPAFVEKNDNYRGTGGTGIATRLLFDFIYRKSL